MIKAAVSSRHALNEPFDRAAPRIPVTLAQAAVDALQEAILSGRLAAGSPLRLEETSRALGMSFSPVREALRELVRLGLAVYVPHKGTHVAQLSADDLRDTYRVRTLLEVEAVRLAAERFDEEDREAAERHLAAYEAALAASAMRDAREAHSAFHFALYQASGSPWLTRLIRPAWENAERYRFMTTGSVQTLRRRRREHHAILAACVEHDGDRAAALLREHLVRTAVRVAQQMGSRLSGDGRGR